jgi:hypothetical protein
MKSPLALHFRQRRRLPLKEKRQLNPEINFEKYMSTNVESITHPDGYVPSKETLLVQLHSVRDNPIGCIFS